MRLSTSLQRGILKTGVGGILNRFKARSRRDTLFFEDIFAEYIINCEKHGYKENIRKLSERWGELLFYELSPDTLKKLPTPILTKIAKKIWSNIGIVDDFHIDRDGNMVHITTKNESITRIIGKNDFMLGFFNGILNARYNSRLKIIDVMQSKESSKYQFKLTHEPINITGKDKSFYDKLNYLEPLDEFTLNDAFRKGIFQLREGNKIYFREKRITIPENTIFHLVGAAHLLLDEIPSISYNFFSKLIEKESTDEQKLTLLKNLLQIMGWGIVKIIVKNKNEIFIGIKNPPYGLQPEKDNWHFLNRIILGYLWLLNRNFRISSIKESYKNLEILYLGK